MTRDIKWREWKSTDPAETMKMFRNLKEDNLVPGIEEYKTPMSELEDKLPVHIIPDKGGIVSNNESIKSSYPTHLKKVTDKDMSAYDRVQRAHKN